MDEVFNKLFDKCCSRIDHATEDEIKVALKLYVKAREFHPFLTQKEFNELADEIKEKSPGVGSFIMAVAITLSQMPEAAFKNEALIDKRIAEAAARQLMAMKMKDSGELSDIDIDPDFDPRNFGRN